MKTALLNATLVCPVGGVSNGGLLIDGETIAAVGDIDVPSDAQRIDVRGKTVDQPKRDPNAGPPAPFVSIVPNEFPTPMVPGDMAFAAVDAAYSMAPYLIGPDEALVITGRWPECVFANVCLWNRWSQMYDYVNRQVSRNRAWRVKKYPRPSRLTMASERRVAWAVPVRPSPSRPTMM